MGQDEGSMKLSLYIAVCTLGQVRAEWALKFGAQVRPMGRRHYIQLLEGFTDINLVRNIAVYIAMQKGAEYLMFYDDDVLPHSAHNMSKLLSTMDQNPDVSVVGGVYPRRSHMPEPLVVQERGGGTWWGWQDGKVHKVYLTATGFTMYRVADLAALDVPVKEMEEGQQVKQFFCSGDGFSDDFYFAELLAQEGKQWWVHGDVTCDQVDLDSTRYEIKDAQQVLVTA